MGEADSDLVAASLGGSQQAYADLLRRYERPVFSLVLRIVRDRADAEEIAQEAFLKAFRNLRSWDPERRFSSWLFKIANNTAIDRLRRRRLATVPLEASDDADRGVIDRTADATSEDPELQLARQDFMAAFEAALMELRTEVRQVLALRYQADLAYEEIAAETGLPLGTVKTYIHRGRRSLAARLEELGWSPERLEKG